MKCTRLYEFFATLVFLQNLPVDAQVTIAKNTQVTPRCGSQLISIEILFDPTQLPEGKFYDWIVVGVSGRPECRLRGNGETKYIIEIAVFNDPCLTQIPARNVFQNRIRIGKNPVVILEGDQSITVKCVYGLPTVETLAMPVINPNFNIDNFVTQGIASPSQGTNRVRPEDFAVATRNNEVLSKNNPIQSVNVPQMSSIDQKNDFNFGRAVEAGRTTDSRSLENAIRPQLPIRVGINQEPVTTPDVTQESQQGIGFTTAPSRSSGFPVLFVLGILFLIILVLLCLLCLFFFLKRRRVERNRRLLIDGVSATDEGKRTGSRLWWTDGSTDGYATPRTQGDSVGSQKAGKPIAASIFDRKSNKKEPKDVPISSVSARKERTDVTTHYAKARPNNRQPTGASGNGIRPKSSTSSLTVGYPAPLPLRSNLEEFVSKTYAVSSYKELASPAYAYAHPEGFNEAEVDVNFENGHKPRRKQQEDDSAVSSYRSITEIVHAAETTNHSTARIDGQETKMEEVLANAVMPIRGFGYRKLTEQEMGRWRNLILRDDKLVHLLMSSKSVGEIEEIFDREEYRHLFSSIKWSEIAQCVHKVLTKPLDRSQSQLHLYVGDVGSDW